MQMLLQGIGWTLLGLLLALLLLLALPHRVELLGEGDHYRLRLWLWCLLPLTLLRHPPKKPKKPPKPKAEKAKKKPDKPAGQKKKKPAMTTWELLALLDSLLPQLGRDCGKILGRMTITRCRFQLVVGAGEDPLETAQRVGQLEAALYSLYAGFSHLLPIRDFAPALYPCFGREESLLEPGYYQLAVRATPLRLLAPGLGLLIKTLRMI